MSIYTDFKYLSLVSHALRNFKATEQYKALFSCPFCGDSNKVKWKARGNIYVYNGKTVFNCFNCGDSKSFGRFLKEVDENLWREWRKEGLKEDPTYKLTIVPQVISVKKEVYLNMRKVSALPEGHPALNYVRDRQIPIIRYPDLFHTLNYRELVEEVFPGKGGRFPEDERLVIPIYNTKTELVGISGRTMSNATIRYATMKSDDQKCFFGLEYMNVSKPVFVVEGPIDSLFLPNAVAVCHAELGMFGRAFPSVNSILVFDNEPLNPDIVKYMEKAIEEERTICVWNDCPLKGKDINQMVLNGASIRDILKFILENSYKGERARFKMIKWRESA